MPLDLLGNVILTFSVVILFFLVLGQPLVKGIKTNKNLKRHGILAALAVVMQTTPFLVVMVPSFANHFRTILSLSPMYAVNAWLHFTFGSAAIISGFAYMGLWLAFFILTNEMYSSKKIHVANANNLGDCGSYRQLNPFAADVLIFPFIGPFKRKCYCQRNLKGGRD